MRSSRIATSLLFGAAFALGVGLSALTCRSPTVVPGQTGASGTSCTFPRGCYIVQASGPLSGQCGDCTGGPQRCRLFFQPTPGAADPLDLGGVFVPNGADLAGTSIPGPSGGPPAITDAPVVCGLYPSAQLPPGTAAVCADVESLCVARGAACTGYCVRAGLSCASGTPIPPQRRPGMPGTDTYCPYTDDVCCPGAMPDLGSKDAAMPTDGAAPDSGASDAAAPTDAQRG
jgi:hypothetical protein